MIKFISKSLFLLLLILNSVYTQVQLSLPDTTKNYDKNITIPISVSDMTGLRIKSYQFRLKYDQSILKLRSVDEDKTLSDLWTWDVDSYLDDEGLLVNAHGWFSLSGSGILLNLKFKVIAEEGYSDLIFDNFIFNQGNPSVELDNGSFRVYAEKEIEFIKVGDGKGNFSINGEVFNLPYKTDLIQGIEYTLKAFPNNGSSFNKWEGGINSTQNPYKFLVGNSTKINLNFSLKSYSVEASVQPEGFGLVSGVGIYQHGELAVLSATPFSGKDFTGWTINGNLVGEDLEYQINITDNLNIMANFESLLLEINAAAKPLNSGQINGTGYYYQNQTAILEACENENWNFDFWSENEEYISSDSIISLEVIEDRSLVANFSIVTEVNHDNEIVNDFFLQDPYPNPFNPTTTFRFGIPQSAEVNFLILDITGRIIEELFDSEVINGGIIEKKFTAQNISSGVYFYYFHANDKQTNNNFVKKGKFVLLK